MRVVLRTGVERVHAVYELGVKHYVSLLRRLGDEVRQSLPCNEIPGADDTRLSGSRGEVGVLLVLALGAEHAVYPAVLVLGEAHVVYVGLLGAGVGEDNGIVAEAETLGRLVALCNREEGLAVSALHACYQAVLSVEVNRAGIHHGVDAKALHEVGVIVVG